MRDSLKDHINANAKDFELYPLEGNDWDQIAKKLTPAKKKYGGRIMGIAASVAILLTASFLLVSNASSSAPDEVAEMEGFYQEAINQKITLVKDQLEDDRILNDLEAMDAAFSELKSDLDENVDNEEVVMAMMDNYRLKLQILEEILMELEKKKGEKAL